MNNITCDICGAPVKKSGRHLTRQHNGHTIRVICAEGKEDICEKCIAEVVLEGTEPAIAMQLKSQLPPFVASAIAAQTAPVATKQ